MKSTIIFAGAAAGIGLLLLSTKKANAATLTPAQVKNLQAQQARARLAAQQNSTTSGLLGILKNLTTPKPAPKSTASAPKSSGGGGGAPKTGGGGTGGTGSGTAQQPTCCDATCIFSFALCCGDSKICVPPDVCLAPVPPLCVPGCTGDPCIVSNLFPCTGVPQLAPQCGGGCGGCGGGVGCCGCADTMLF